MDGLTEFIKGFFSFLLRNKWRIALIPILMLAWIPFIFPYGDLRAVVATTVSRAMGNGFAIDFNHIALAPGVPIAVEVEEFEFNGPGLPTVSADRLKASPSLTSPLSGGRIEAEGMFKGSVNASLSSGSRAKSGGTRHAIETQVSGVQLGALTDSLRRAGMMPFAMQGTLDTTGSASFDPSFEEQPDGEIFLQGKALSIPSVSIPIPLPNFAPIQTPSLELGRINLKGKLAGGKLQIEDFSFGQPTDALSGRIRGELGITFTKEGEGGRVKPVSGPFDLKVELSLSNSLMDAMNKSGAGLALLPIDGFKKVVGDTLKYAFSVKGEAFGLAPRFSGLEKEN